MNFNKNNHAILVIILGGTPMVRSLSIALLILVVIIVNTVFNNTYAAEHCIIIFNIKLASVLSGVG